MACLLGREYSRKLQVCHVKSHVKIKGETELQSITVFLFEYTGFSYLIMIYLQLFSGWKGLAEVWNSKEIKGNGIPPENLVPMQKSGNLSNL